MEPKMLTCQAKAYTVNTKLRLAPNFKNYEYLEERGVTLTMMIFVCKTSSLFKWLSSGVPPNSRMLKRGLRSFLNTWTSTLRTSLSSFLTSKNTILPINLFLILSISRGFSSDTCVKMASSAISKIAIKIPAVSRPKLCSSLFRKWWITTRVTRWTRSRRSGNRWSQLKSKR